jgi:hypothetical protein
VCSLELQQKLGGFYTDPFQVQVGSVIEEFTSQVQKNWLFCNTGRSKATRSQLARTKISHVLNIRVKTATTSASYFGPLS